MHDAGQSTRTFTIARLRGLPLPATLYVSRLGARSVAPPKPTVEEGIDTEWLAAAARHDPLSHAYARWDIEHALDRVRFVTIREDAHPTAYLLIWYGWRAFPVVHWIGETRFPDQLAPWLPIRPLVAVVPSSAMTAVEAVRGPTVPIPLLLLEHSQESPVPTPARFVRPLTRVDTPTVAALAEQHGELLTTTYPTLDLDRSLTMGAFENDRLVGLGRVAVQLPEIWILSGIFTVAEARRKGYGVALTAALTQAAHTAGARAALFVRADNLPAVRMYEHLGYWRRHEKVWMDAGTHARP